MNRTSQVTGAAALLLALAGPAAAADWAHWRGPTQTGVSQETNLPDKWSQDPAKAGSNLVWRVPYGCRSTPMVMGGRVFIINSDGSGADEGERVMALDAATGKVAWEYKFNVWHTDIVSSRVGWTNLAGDPATGYVYAHGVQGLLLCLEAATGKLVWQRSLTEEFGRVSGYGGRVVSPTIDGDLVIVGMINGSWGDQGRGSNRFVAFDKKTGVVQWWSSPCEAMKGTYYSNPIVATIKGQRLLITGAADGELIALQVRTGVKAWSFPVGVNVVNTSPVIEGNFIYVTHGEENQDVAEQGRVVCVDAGTIVNGRPRLVWDKVGIKAGLASPLVHAGRLYVPDDGATLFCFDSKTGEQLWKFKYGRVSRGSPVWADGKIYVAEVNARFHILKPEEKRCRELDNQFFQSKDGQGFVETNGTPAVADGRIYFGTRDYLYCIGKAKEPAAERKTVAALPLIPGGAKSAAGEPAHVQVVPADVTLASGGSVEFKVRLFDKDGNFLKESPAEWSLPMPPKTPAGLQPPALNGEIKDGKLTVAKAVPGQQAYVDAKVGSLTGRARVRVAPQLPYAMDFERVPVGATPGGWINAQGKYAVVEHQGGRVLKKLAENPAPPVARANAYITLATATNYTIQADLSGAVKGNNLPDMGIVNQRYTLQMSGNKQELRLLSWEALPRIDKTIPFKWQSGEWYRARLTVEQNGGKAVVRGKVWPKSGQEPAAWTIEVEDPRPNPSGSAALYGYATGILGGQTGAEIYYDNVTVTPNK